MAGRALGFGLNLLLSRGLGPAGLGLFSLVLTTCQTFEIVARGGVDYGLSCALTGSAAKGSDLEKASLAQSALQFVQLSTLILAVALWIWVIPLEGLLPIGLRVNRVTAAVALVAIAALESLGGLPWDLLILAGETKRAALRQGLFAPLKLLVALAGAASYGVSGALAGYGLASAAQLVWLHRICKPLWPWPKHFWPHWKKTWMLIRDGVALYGTNALSALVFLPLVSEVAKNAGVDEVGFLRIGQIVVQLFTLLPAALTPLLFLKLRATSTDEQQASFEASLRLIWWLGLSALLAYLLVDQILIDLFFGKAYLESLQPTRLLVLMAVLDSVNQVLHTPLLARRCTRLFAISQNSGAALAAGLGWWLTPSMGLQGFLAAKLCFSALPVGIYLLEGWSRLRQTRMVALLLLATLALTPLCWLSSIETTWSLTLGGLAGFVLILEGRPVLQLLPRR